MREVRTRLGERTGLKVGDPLVVRLDEDGLRIESRRAAVRAAQSMVRERVPKGELLTERLFQMRRAETEIGPVSAARRRSMHPPSRPTAAGRP